MRDPSGDGYSWQRKLVHRGTLTLHTAFHRADNKEPAAITALAISKVCNNLVNNEVLWYFCLFVNISSASSPFHEIFFKSSTVDRYYLFKEKLRLGAQLSTILLLDHHLLDFKEVLYLVDKGRVISLRIPRPRPFSKKKKKLPREG